MCKHCYCKSEENILSVIGHLIRIKNDASYRIKNSLNDGESFIYLTACLDTLEMLGYNRKNLLERMRKCDEND